MKNQSQAMKKLGKLRKSKEHPGKSKGNQGKLRKTKEKQREPMKSKEKHWKINENQ